MGSLWPGGGQQVGTAQAGMSSDLITEAGDPGAEFRTRSRPGQSSTREAGSAPASRGMEWGVAGSQQRDPKLAKPGWKRGQGLSDHSTRTRCAGLWAQGAPRVWTGSLSSRTRGLAKKGARKTTRRSWVRCGGDGGQSQAERIPEGSQGAVPPPPEGPPSCSRAPGGGAQGSSQQERPALGKRHMPIWDLSRPQKPKSRQHSLGTGQITGSTLRATGSLGSAHSSRMSTQPPACSAAGRRTTSPPRPRPVNRQPQFCLRPAGEGQNKSCLQ